MPHRAAPRRLPFRRLLDRALGLPPPDAVLRVTVRGMPPDAPARDREGAREFAVPLALLLTLLTAGDPEETARLLTQRHADLLAGHDATGCPHELAGGATECAACGWAAAAPPWPRPFDYAAVLDRSSDPAAVLDRAAEFARAEGAPAPGGEDGGEDGGWFAPDGAVGVVLVRSFLAGECPGCGAAPGEPCRPPDDDLGEERLDAAEAAAEAAAETMAAFGAIGRRLRPLEALPGQILLTVAAGPGRHPEAWRMAASGVWIALAGEETEDVHAEQVTAARLRRRLAAR